MTHTRLVDGTESVIVRHRVEEGYYKAVVETDAARRTLTFMPTGFESTYEYPLIVFLHRDGSSERQIIRLIPHLSRRNYIVMGLRGLAEVYRADGRKGYSWDVDAGLTNELEDYALAAIADAYDRLPVHADRIFLAGAGEGAVQAYRLAFSYPNKFAGVIALNGKLPKNGPLWRLNQTRQLPVFMGHGIANLSIPIAQARQDHVLLYTAGMDVSFRSYSSSERIHPDMLRDINLWTMRQVIGE
jgi:phospholipase/carboxylesterase